MNKFEKDLQQENEYPAIHKGFKGLFWNIAHFKSFPEGEKKKALKQMAFFGVAGIASAVMLFAILVSVISFFTPVDMNAKNFVSNWNRMAKSEENLTCGIKIKSDKGWFDYELGNGAKLEGEIVKSGIFGKKELVSARYTFADTDKPNIENFINNYVSLFDEIKNKDEAVKQLLSKKESLIPSGITGVVCYDRKLEFMYAYSEKYKEINLTGLSFGCSFDDALNSFNDGYAKAKNDKYHYKPFPTDQEFIDSANSLIYSILKAPSTATLVSSEVFEKDYYGRAVVLMTVDAENSFGAYIRKNYCVVIQGINYDGTFDYYKTNYVQTYTETTKSATIEALKKINGFGKDRSGGNIFESSDFSKSTCDSYNKYYNGVLSYFVDGKTNTVFAGEYGFETNNEIEVTEKLANITINSIVATNVSVGKYFDFSSNQIKTDYKYDNGVLYYASNNCIGAIAMSTDVYKNIETCLASADYLNAEDICEMLRK